MIFKTLMALCAAAFCGAALAQQTVGFATLQPGTLLNAQASVIAKVVQDHTKLQVRVIGHGGDTGIIDAVNSKQADFLLLDVGEPAEAMKGENVWKGNPKPNIRLAMSLYGFQMAFWVRKDSPIQSIADLKGKNIPTEWVQQTSVITHLNALLAAGGVSLNDVKKVPTVNVIRASEDFKSGKIDVFFFAVGAPKVQTIDFIIGVGTHVKDDVVRDFVRAVHDNKQSLVEGHPNFNAFDPSQAGKRQPRLPFHPAAEKYWKETELLK